MVASRLRNLKVARRLLEKKADVNKKNEYNSTALYLAALSENKDLVQLLLDEKAEVTQSLIEEMSRISHTQEGKDIINLLVDRLRTQQADLPEEQEEKK